ncbi:MAG: hypothetical protein ACE5K9_06345 [Candidatus Methylomirabilales bacterium]
MKKVCIPVIMILLCVGCVSITPEHAIGPFSRQPIEKESLGFLEIGSTTREEVLLHLGDPDYARDNERIFVYHWTTMSGKEIGWVGYREPSKYETRKKYQVIIGFDQTGIVNIYETKIEEL